MNLHKRLENSHDLLEMCILFQLQDTDLDDIVVPHLLLSQWKTLNISRNSLTNISKLVSAMIQKQTIRALWLEGNNLSSGFDLANLLDASPCLQVLSLNHNCLTDVGVAQLASVSRCSLRELWLDSNGLTSAAGPSIGKILSSWSSLQQMYLNGNRIGDEGFNCMIWALTSSHCNLEVLSLNRNEITDVSMQALADAMYCSKLKLETVWLANNYISVIGVDTLARGVKLGLSSCNQIYLPANPLIERDNILMALGALADILELRHSKWMKIVLVMLHCSRTVTIRYKLPPDIVRRIATVLNPKI